MAPRLTQPLAEMSTRNLLGGEAGSGRKPDNLTAIGKPTRSLKVSEPHRPPRPVTWDVYFFTFY
jgi:hypothetical protein